MGQKWPTVIFHVSVFLLYIFKCIPTLKIPSILLLTWVFDWCRPLSTSFVLYFIVISLRLSFQKGNGTTNKAFHKFTNICPHNHEALIWPQLKSTQTWRLKEWKRSVKKKERKSIDNKQHTIKGEKILSSAEGGSLGSEGDSGLGLNHNNTSV